MERVRNAVLYAAERAGQLEKGETKILEPTDMPELNRREVYRNRTEKSQWGRKEKRTLKISYDEREKKGKDEEVVGGNEDKPNNDEAIRCPTHAISVNSLSHTESNFLQQFLHSGHEFLPLCCPLISLMSLQIPLFCLVVPPSELRRQGYIDYLNRTSRRRLTSPCI